MKAVFKHELSSCFTNMTAYVFAAFMLLFAGIYTMAYNISAAYTNFEYVLSAISFIFLIIVPVLTMRTLAEEKKQRTDQLLYSLPITMTKVVLGKYAAMLVVLLLPTGIISIYPLILSAYGNVYLPAAYGAIIGFYFLGSALIAIGMFVSSLTESQAVAAGLCFVVLLINYFLTSLASFMSSSTSFSFIAFSVVIILVMLVFYFMTHSTLVAGLIFIVAETVLFAFYLFKQDSFAGLFPDVLKQLSLFGRFENFVNGVFDISALVFFVTVAGFFLFLSVQSMEKRRWS
jgi:ABC-2 type transport system permease protein